MSLSSRSAKSGEVCPPANKRPVRLLSLTATYPNPDDPQPGSFIQSRLRRVAALAEIWVVAPIAKVSFSSLPHVLVDTGNIPIERQDGRLRVLHPRWIYPPMAGWLNSLFLAAQVIGPVLQLRKEFDFQVIDSHFGHPDGVAAALLSSWTGRPFTITLRGSEVEHARLRLRRIAMAWALKRASRVFAVSERLREFAISLGVDAHRVLTIPNGIDVAVYHPQDRAALRRKHGIDPDRQMILSAGHLTQLKGHHLVVRAVKGLVDRGLPVDFLIVGDSGRGASYEHVIRSEIASLGLENHVRLPGRVSPQTMAELMSAADVFCLASSREGWPNVVHEAMACGTPVVATDVGAIPEMIPSQSLGLIVPPGDVGALTDALGRALGKAWDRQAIAAWGQARSWDRVAAEVVDAMRAVVDESSGSR